eukprot:1751793-Rhodomonas_salina.3
MCIRDRGMVLPGALRAEHDLTAQVCALPSPRTAAIYGGYAVIYRVNAALYGGGAAVNSCSALVFWTQRRN